MPNADPIANPKLATKRKCPKKKSLMPPMYLNLVASAALLAIASVKHKITQIEVPVVRKIVISANLEYKNKGAIQMKSHNPFFILIQKLIVDFLNVLLLKHIGETGNHLFTDTIKIIH